MLLEQVNHVMAHIWSVQHARPISGGYISEKENDEVRVRAEGEQGLQTRSTLRTEAPSHQQQAYETYWRVFKIDIRSRLPSVLHLCT